MGCKKVVIPSVIISKWQSILNLVRELLEVQDAVIARLEDTYLEIFQTSQNKENTFMAGDKVKPSKHFCEYVIKNNEQLVITNASKEMKWHNYLEVEEGLISYIGLPLRWPDGKLFGVFCIHDNKENDFDPKSVSIMKQFKELLESHLQIIYQNNQLFHQIEEKKKIENQINRTNKRFKIIYKNIKQGICLHEMVYRNKAAVDYRIIDANPAFEKILKIPLEKAIGSLASRLYGFDEVPYLDIYSHIAETQDSVTFDTYYSPMQKYFNITVTSPEKGKFITLFNDVTDRKNYETKLKKQQEQLLASYEELTAYNEEITAMNEELEQSLDQINNLNQRFVTMINLISNLQKSSQGINKNFLSELLKTAISIVPEADYGKICLFDNEDYCIFIDAIGHDIELLKKIRVDKRALFHFSDEGTYQSDEYSLDLQKLREDQKDIFAKALKPIEKSIYINININSDIVGRITLDIARGSKKEFTSITKHLLQSFSSLGSAFFSFQRYNDLQEDFVRELIISIIQILEMYDKYTSGHSQHVAELGVKIAEKMGLSERDIRSTYWAGMVHDLGKLVVPLSILNKKGPLNDNEYEIIQNHPVWSYKSLNKSKKLRQIAEYVLYHHERWDGKGYPQGLKGDKIPLVSQILTVVDAWDAMTSRRSYREPLSKGMAINEITKNKGLQFSPLVVDAFLEYMEKEKTVE